MIQNIFIVHTPFHVFIAEMIVRNGLVKYNYENVILLELNKEYNNVDNGLWSVIRYLHNVGKSTLGRKSYLLSEKNIDIIKEFAEKNKETNIFISDIAWPMNNRVFFDKYLRRETKFCLFSDGLGTYTLPKVTRALFVRGLFKSLNGLIRRGVRYTNYLGNQFGLDRKEIEYIYAPNVEFLRCNPSKKRDVSFDSINAVENFNTEKCLFLDQPFWLHMEDSKWYEIRAVAIKFMQSLHTKDCYYKNHYFGRKEEEIYFANKGFKIIHSNQCAEQIVAENNFGIVISYNSSALFNLKCIYHNKLRCISLCSKVISLAPGYNYNESAHVIELFKAVNVEMVEIL